MPETTVTDDSTIGPAPLAEHGPPNQDEKVKSFTSLVPLSAWGPLPMLETKLENPMVTSYYKKAVEDSEGSESSGDEEGPPSYHDLAMELGNNGFEKGSDASMSEDEAIHWLQEKIENSIAIDTMEILMGEKVVESLIQTDHLVALKLKGAELLAFDPRIDVGPEGITEQAVREAAIAYRQGLTSPAGEPFTFALPKEVVRTLGILFRNDPGKLEPWIREGWYRNLPVPLEAPPHVRACQC
ncbi:hypothetical protein DFP72DRAFT_910453 [Ephemerocybe angulata]|uniref:Uncharacterized protein n=1 Tax=Ephemerocybe angulata TaxID=980116 RepID=A0A8H6HP06_9AGAR|nr:hypothetical protein DFP72DRAFT_910453 [Tulosesus angulatus]